MSDQRFWAAQSLVTEPGPAAAAIDRLPSDPGAVDPERFITDPGLEIWAWLRHNLVHDLAALNKTEMLLHDVWGVDSRTPPGPGELPALDELAALTGQPADPALWQGWQFQS